MPSCQHERSTVMSSTCCAMLGYQSETQIPLWPCCFQVRFEGISVLPPVPMAVMGLPNDAGSGWPASRASSGFGSNRSTWLGPPSMKTQITDLALGGKCGAFGASGSSAGTLAPARLSPSSAEKASAPNPLPVFHRNSRRDRFLIERPSVDVDELVRVHQGLAEVHQGRGLELIGAGRRGDRLTGLVALRQNLELAIEERQRGISLRGIGRAGVSQVEGPFDLG